MKKFNVIVEDANSKFVPYDVIPYLEKRYYEGDDRPNTFDEFKIFIERNSIYKWWSRDEYKITLKGKSEESVIDVHQQVMMNIDRIAEILMEEISNEML